MRRCDPSPLHAVLTSVVGLRRHWVICFTLLALVLQTVHAGSQDREYQVKAAFLLNFARFTEWPPAAFGRPDAPLVVCTFDENPFGDTLAGTLANERAGGHPLQSNTISAISEVSQCHLLFVPRAQTRRTTEIVTSRDDQSVVLIGEDDGFLPAGGDINLTIEQGRVRFEINPQRVARGNVRFSSHLLRLAKNAREVVP